MDGVAALESGVMCFLPVFFRVCLISSALVLHTRRCFTFVLCFVTDHPTSSRHKVWIQMVEQRAMYALCITINQHLPPVEMLAHTCCARITNLMALLCPSCMSRWMKLGRKLTSSASFSR